MLVTEEEAKTKRCQEGFGPAHAPLHQSGIISPVMCIGSACMAWRWADEDLQGRKHLPDDAPLNAAGLSHRAFTGLYHAGLESVGGVRKLNDAELLRIPSFGRTSLVEVKKLIFTNAEEIAAGRRGYCGKAGKP